MATTQTLTLTLTLAPPPPPTGFPLLLRRPPPPLLPHARRPCLLRASAAAPPLAASEYGGWDEILSPSVGSSSHGEFAQLRRFLASVGVDDQRHVFTFVLGAVVSMAIARVRLSTMVVVPASAIVFLLGFCVGVSGFFREFVARDGGGDSVNEESRRLFGVYDEKLRSLGRYFGELNGKISDLRDGLEAAVEGNRIEVNEVRRYIETLEAVKVGVIVPARNLLEGASVVSDWESFCSHKSFSDSGVLDKRLVGDSQKLEKDSTSNHRMRKQRRDLLVVGMEFARVLVGGLFLENLSVSKKANGNANNAAGKSILGESGNGQVSASVYHDNSLMQDRQGVRSFDRDSQGSMMDQNSEAGEGENIDCRGTFPSSVAMPLKFDNFDGSDLRKGDPSLLQRIEERTSSDVSLAKDRNFKQAASAFNTKSNINGGHRCGEEEHLSDENLNFHPDDLEFRDHRGHLNRTSREPKIFRMRYLESLTSSSSISSHHSGNTKHYMHMDKFGAGMPSSVKMDSVNGNNQPSVDGFGPVSDQVGDSSLSSTTVSDDEDFGYHLEHGCQLLKQARKYLTFQTDEELSETLLCESTALLSRAVSINPESVSAVGQLGNAYLLHGELKLKISRDLRKLLSDRMGESETHSLTREKVANVLVEVSEECEQLLVEAGRKYRVALTIDGNDVRALYNWGLALSYRGQLLSDIGPEAAFDADKVYLAAIDKFDALMSKSRTYAPEALYRWATTLQQRSRLRPRSSKDKIKLLQQAKRLFEDALYLNTGNKQVKEALSSCISELNSRHP